jgi:hypothetical protein
MVRISIVSLIYKSPKLTDWVYESVHEYTPLIKKGEAEFFFVANDPSEKLLSHLESKGYNYIIQKNKVLSKEELFAMGYAWPEYIHRVYRGYNRGILHSKGEIIVLINSDNYFSPDWLENLLKYLDSKKIVCSQIVEPKHAIHGIFPRAINGEFGNTPENFKKKEFLDFSMKKRRTGAIFGGAYMPCMFYKDLAIYAGLYPEGNLADESFEKILLTGDEAFFSNLLKNNITHITALDSIVYHLKEGEKDESPDSIHESLGVVTNNHNNYPIDFNKLPSLTTEYFEVVLQPTLEHTYIINQLLNVPSESIIKDNSKNGSERVFKKIKRYLKNNLPLILVNKIIKINKILKRDFQLES